jgi:hypothetical protein
MARELSWSAERLALELTRFAEEARAEGIVVDARSPDDRRTPDTPPAPMP